MAFLVFEGLDGSGKTTLMEQLRRELEGRSIPIHLTREPGGTALGDEIRQLLLRVQGEAPVPRAELLLYEAARAQHVDKVIRPKLAAGHWVLCDRYSASSLAFQCGGRGLAAAEVTWLNDFATDRLRPDLTVLLDLTVNESLRRMQMRGSEADRFEREAQEFHERVRQAYLQIAQADKNHWLVLDAAMPVEQLLQSLLRTLQERTWLKK